LARNRDAVEAYKRGVQVIESVRSRLREDRFRAGYIEDKYHVYTALVGLQLKLDEPRGAFIYSEKLRAYSYLDLLDRGRPPIPDAAQRQTESELLARVRQLEKALEEENAQPSPYQRREAVRVLSSELLDAERDYQSFIGDLQQTQPRYASARSLSIPSPEEIQSLLPEDTALIEYVVAPDSVAAFVVTTHSLRAKRLPLETQDLHSKVELFRDLVARREEDGWRKPAASLYAALIAPLKQAGWLLDIDRLYLVPHGMLHYIPFAALPHPSENGARYLAENYVLHYLPAATALAYPNERSKPTKGLLAMAPNCARLHHAREEARAVRDLFSEGSLALVGDGATESAFKHLAGQYAMVHLATHGVFNKLNPLLSGVELESDEREDGRLEVHEILGLRLRGDLVTLSACDTALGTGYFAEVPAGDDFVGLNRAFLFAGSRSVLATLWEVDDASTLKLMGRFYQRLQQVDPASALAEAQRDRIRDGGQEAHPFHWAPFVLTGGFSTKRLLTRKNESRVRVHEQAALTTLSPGLTTAGRRRLRP
jgi:CHAT domain-containing protein